MARHKIYVYKDFLCRTVLRMQARLVKKLK